MSGRPIASRRRSRPSWRSLLVLALLLAGCGEADRAAAPTPDAAPVAFRAWVDTSSAAPGETVTLHAEVVHDPGVELDLPAVLEAIPNPRIREPGAWETAPDLGGRGVQRLAIVLDPGVGPLLSIPSFTLRWREGDADSWHEISSAPMTVEVSPAADPVAAGDLEFREPLDPEALPEPPPAPERERSTVLAVAAAVAAALALAAAAAVLLARRRRRRVATARGPAPEEIALAELDRLEALQLAAAGRVKELYYRLTAILRRYIEDRFGITAPEQTTEEFLAAMRDDARLPEKEVLAELLAGADLVKYARHQPETRHVDAAFAVARRFVTVAAAAATPEDSGAA